MANLDGMKREYIVIENNDYKYLSPESCDALDQIHDEILHGKRHEGKEKEKFLVINVNEPYADEIIEIMKRHENNSIGSAGY